MSISLHQRKVWHLTNLIPFNVTPPKAADDACKDEPNGTRPLISKGSFWGFVKKKMFLVKSQSCARNLVQF